MYKLQWSHWALRGLYSLCIFSVIEILATLAHFGRMVHAERGVVIDKEAYRNFGWAYLLGCIADVLLLIALIFFVLYYLKDRKKRMETPQFNPLMFQQGQQVMMPPPPGQQFQFPPQGQYQQELRGPPPGQFQQQQQMQFAPPPQRQYAPQQQQYMSEKQALNYS